jgi:hypothetical protein
MNTAQRIAYLIEVCLLLATGPAQAALTGPSCYTVDSTTSKVQQYRLYFDSSLDGHYMIGGRAYVRTPTALGTVALSYPVSGGAYTIDGGAIYVGVTVVWVNTTASGTAVYPFQALLFINGSQSNVVEQLDSVRVTYPLTAVACPPIS